MPDFSLIRLKWDFLLGLHPLFLIAKSLPTVEDADNDRFGPIPFNDVDSLKNEITMLRSDFNLNIIKQQQFDISELAEGDPILEKLHLELDLLLEKLEDMVIDPQVREIKETNVSFILCFYMPSSSVI